MKALVYFPSGNINTLDIENSLEGLQSLVGGYIDYIGFDKNIDMVINDEGKLDGLPINRMLCYDGKIYDFVCGNAVFVGHDGEGNTVELTSEQIAYVKHHICANRYTFERGE